MAQAKAFVLMADSYHEPGYIKEGLRPVFAAENVEVEFTEDVKALSAEKLQGRQLLVIHRDGMIWPNGYDQPYVMWMTREQEQAIADFVRNGGGFMPLHNSIAIYPKDGPYREVCAGHFISHPAVETFSVYIINKEHPITQGAEDYEITDEQHFVECDADRVELLLRSHSDTHGTSPAGWAYEYGQGRVCFLANGHTLEAIQHSTYQTLLKNAVQWCLRRIK